jgi:hypothetical protein
LNKTFFFDVSISNIKVLNFIVAVLCIILADNLNQAVDCLFFNQQIVIKIEFSQPSKLYTGQSAQSDGSNVILSCILNILPRSIFSSELTIVILSSRKAKDRSSKLVLDKFNTFKLGKY